MRTPHAPDISVVMTGHREGRLIHQSLRSVGRAVEYAADDGISSEIIVILDRADDLTRVVVAAAGDRVTVADVDYGDSGPSRNHGVRLARGQFVAFLDGDDLFCRPWLRLAYHAASAGGPAVIHPRYTVLFDGEKTLIRHLATDHPVFKPSDMLEFCHWLSAYFAPRALLAEHPFRPCPRGGGFGSEDWHWYCEVVAERVPVVALDQTCLFYRRREGSRSSDHQSALTLKRPARLFDPAVLRVLNARHLNIHREEPMPAPAAPVPVPEPAAAPPVAPPAPPRLRVTPKRAVRAVGKRLLPWPVRHQLRVFSGRVHAPPPPLAAPPPIPPMPEPALPAVAATPTLPAWLIGEWRDAHELDPQLLPTPAVLAEYQYALDNHWGDSPLGDAYVALCRSLPQRFSHLLLVPWLKTGGSDRTALNYAQALTDARLADGVVVMATEKTGSPWAGRLPPEVTFVSAGELFPRLSVVQMERLIAQVVLQWTPRVVHVLNSYAGYRTIQRHGAALTTASSLYVHVFCDNIEADGRWHGYNRSMLPKVMDTVTAVLSDNQTELDVLAPVYGWPAEKLLTHYQPVEVHRRPLTRRVGNKLRVLWAGRMERQKRPDLLTEIAARCVDFPFEFHMYGSAVCTDAIAVSPGPNIVYHGPFDGFASLPTDRHDVFLYTSQWDGLPNILQEAMAVGLPVVASDVGGVAELVRGGETGHLIRPFDDVAAYVDALVAVHRGRASTARLVENAYDLLARQHSWERFIQSIRKTPGYAVERPAALRLAA